KIVAYAQGFEHLATGSREHRWDLDLGALATIWRGGCIIRAKFLDRIKDAYEQAPDLPSLMLAPFFQEALATAQPAWRRVVTTAHLVTQSVTTMAKPTIATAPRTAPRESIDASSLPSFSEHRERDHQGTGRELFHAALAGRCARANLRRRSNMTAASSARRRPG